jgi:acetyl esterase/lipase
MMRGCAVALITCFWLVSLAVADAAEPFPGPASDHNGAAMRAVPIGTANAQVLVPATASSGRPWVLAASLYDLENPALVNLARTQHELVKHGFHVVAIEPGAILGAPDLEARWDAVYREMTARFGLSREVVLMGVGREGMPALRWAAENPGKVSCVYLDKAVCQEPQATASTLNPVALAEKLAAARVGIIYVAGGQDEIVPFAENGAVIQKVFESKGLFFRPLKQPTEGHHPHGLSDPREILRLIRMNTYAVPPTRSLVAYGPHFSQVLDFWKADSPEPTPVVVFIHGGGWGTGTRRGVGALEAYLKAGISVVAVDYRFIVQAKADGIVPPLRGPMYDVARAVQFVRSKSAEWGLRKERIGLTGGSAGGCSSLWLAFHPDLADPTSTDPVARESTRPYCVAVDGPQTTLDPRQMKEWTPNSNYGSYAFGVKGGFAAFLDQRESLLPWIAEYSPYALAAADAPPVFMHFLDTPNLGHEQKDPTHTVNFGVKLQERLRELNVPCELLYPGAPDATHTSVSDYLIARLAVRQSTEPK